MRGISVHRRGVVAGVVVAVVTAGVVAACTPPTEPIVTFPTPTGALAVADAPNELRGPLRVQGRQMVDADGRVVLLHGVNAVQKSAPFLYSVENGSLNGTSLAELRRRGYNAIRLGVWPAALMPAVGQVDTAYLDNVATAVADLEAEGFWVLLDLHQDVFWGMPDWATPANAADLSESPAPAFASIGWAGAYTSDKSLRQWDAWWSNEPVAPGGPGVVDAYGVGVRALAERMKDVPNVVGIELLNEPFP
ncbi:MAG: cellulase family glycosylhydrolase, partial [Actinomycetes bacterium]